MTPYNMRVLTYLLISVFLGTVVSCSRSNNSNSRDSSPNFNPGQPRDIHENPPLTVLPPPPPTASQPIALSSDCLDNTIGNFCTFNRNPIFQNGSALSGDPTNVSELGSLQAASVMIKSLDNSGFLRNSNFTINLVGGEEIQRISQNWNVSLSADGINAFMQVNSYFWLNYAINRGTELFGTMFAIGKQIKVFVNDRFSGWSAAGNSIHLGNTEAVYPSGLDSSIILHHYGLANLHYATDGKLRSFSNDSKHTDCGTDGNRIVRGCCVSVDGCSMAIANGIAEFFQAVILSDTPVFGATKSNDDSGLSRCSISRDLNDIKDTSVSTIFNACSTQSASGYVHLMGSIYASIWWNIRQSVVKPIDASRHPVDELFHAHLSQISSEDDFLSVFSKISQLDQSMFSGAHTARIRDEFTRRGIALP